MTKTPSTVVESHSIDFVPLTERYGTPRRLFTIWFSANTTILAVALGTLAISQGLSLGGAILAFILGNAVGTVFMAAHSAQGPQLGVPQMIQSRAQFGVLGAGLPLVAVVLTYLLYCAANGILIQSLVKALLPFDGNGALILLSSVTLLVAFVGYELIHRLGALMTVISIVIFVAATYLLITQTGGDATAATAPVAFNRSAFILTMTQAAAWSLSYGPYVADYSRYLPPDVPPAKTFWYTALGCFISSALVMSFGAWLATEHPALAKDPGGAISGLFGPLQTLVQWLLLIGVVQGNVLNLYSAYMSSVTVFTGVHGMKLIGQWQKLLVLVVLMGIATTISLLAQDDFNAYFSDAMNAMVYLLVPWSAINLADYYLVRKGRYRIADLFRVEGEYGAFRWKTLGVFAVAILVQVPFMNLSFFQGPVAKWIGADLAWIPALLVPGMLHVWVERGASAPAALRGVA